MKHIFAPATLSAIIFLIPMVAIGAQPAFTTDPSKMETEAQDKAWKKDLDKACRYLKGTRTPSPSEAEECRRLADEEPRCLLYKDFASIYWKMRDGGGALTDVAEGLAAMQKNTELYPRDFFNAIRKLSQVIFFTDRDKLGTNEEFSGRAYRACMSGQLL